MSDRWTIERATPADVDSWLEIVAAVEPWFGPMPDFRNTLDRSSQRDGARCVRSGAIVIGGMILSDPDAARISWLAVRESHRRLGVGSALIRAAIDEFHAADEIIVDTFGDDHPAGAPARRLYEAFGFRPAEILPIGPEGGSRQRYRRHRRDAAAAR
jgi:ribosomal protein S18 acetylase RimI-like enzyme